ncbi:MAG TPA: glycosyltransferase family 4 protein [Polyangia bacterium]|nr:glycosyltransferase family 4 protein [Polyangia bacterium]
MSATSDRSVLFTGEQFFLRRRRPLIDAVEASGLKIGLLPVQERTPRETLDVAISMAEFGARALLAADDRPLRDRLDPRNLRQAFPKSVESFEVKSRQMANKLATRSAQFDVILHVFCLSSPFVGPPTIPYAHYLDYTYALSMRNNPEEPRPFSKEDRDRWLELERSSYARASKLFPMSALVRDSLINDYGVDPEKIVVVGAGGNVLRPVQKPKSFGSRQLLFNASDFYRKGGDAVMAAFANLQARDPSLRLVTVGRPLPREYAGQPGVTDRGALHGTDLLELFDGSDLVLGPARCDPFPGFVIEAMNAGTPSVVAAFDGMPEIVTDGVDGVVLPRVETALVEAAIFDLVNDTEKLRRFSEAGRRKIRERLNWSSVAEKMMPFLRGDA